jgi:DNA-binding CsgD family transcriptional regulator
MAASTPMPMTRRRERYASDGLVDRDRELAALRQILRAAHAGAGGVVFLEGPGGGGKSRLLEAARDAAVGAPMRVLTAAGVELEREFPFALAMRLFAPMSLAGAGGDEFSMIQGLFQAIKDLAGARSADDGGQGLAILIDDVHWADRPSLHFLCYVAERIADLPIAIVLAATTGERSADARALATLRRAAGTGLLTLAPLSAGGVSRAVRRRFPQADEELCASCAQASGGNPFLLAELLTAMTEDDGTPAAAHVARRRIEEIVPDAVRDSVAARLEAMPPATRAVAEAVAVLDEGAPVARVSRLAGLDSATVLLAADELSAMGLLAPGITLTFAQPMLGTAIRASLAPFERAQAHLRAARILSEQQAGAELIAEHLLEAPADEDPAAVAALRQAAEAALGRGEPQRATRLLNRALAEHPTGGLRLRLEAELTAARVIGLLIADDLEEALELCEHARPTPGGGDPTPAQEPIDCVRAWALYEQGLLTDARAAASAALDSATDAGGYAQGARAVLARCHIEQGDLEEAESVIATIERDGSRDLLLRALVFDVRAQLRLAQHRPREALRDAMHAGALLAEQLSDASPAPVAWRSTAALAHLALGEPQHARRLVGRELELSRAVGVTRTIVRDLRILGLALGGEPAGVETLARAVAIGGSHPGRLEHVRALIDYGSALRRSGRRVDAREPLREGLDLGHRGGAGVLESRARAELIATGARPRRAPVRGVDSLTTSQRRVAELAAGGLTTRQIAGALCVTPKTVEFHLRNIYSKLGVSSREELTKELPVTGSLPGARESGGS